MADVRERLSDDLRAAMVGGDRATVRVLRAALAAVANAEAQPLDSHSPAGATEVERRELSAADVEAVLRGEVEEAEEAAAELAAAGRPDAAGELRATAELLGRYLG